MRPFDFPVVAVATSLPCAVPSETVDATALLPSTAPALRAKSTAATAVPDSATASAMSATTIAGDGILPLM